MEIKTCFKDLVDVREIHDPEDKALGYVQAINDAIEVMEEAGRAKDPGIGDPDIFVANLEFPSKGIRIQR